MFLGHAPRRRRALREEPERSRPRVRSRVERHLRVILGYGDLVAITKPIVGSFGRRPFGSRLC